MERMTAANGMSFRVGFTGYSGHLRVEPLPPVEGPDPRRGLPDFILPPAFEPETRESVRKQLEEHLSPILDPDEFSAEKAGMQWDFDWFDRAKLHMDPSAPRSVMVPAWELPFRRKKDDNLPGIWDPDSVEIEVPKLMEGAEDLGSLSRMPGPAKDFVRGNTKNRPFRPGGPEETLASESRLPRDACNGNWIHEILSGSQPQKIPPGFKHGIDLGPLKEYPYTWNCHKNQSELLQGSFETILSMQFADIFGKEWEENIDPEQKSGPESVELEADMGEMPVTLDPEPGEMPATNVSLDVEADRDETPVHDATHDRESILDKIMATGPGSLEGKTRDDCKSDQLETWGMVATQDIASNFYQLVPELALDFPFELDKFQKEAIYFLERGESVFVAAHTSAGKTVVAEYAFALASKHCTRAVYTAPIKTISNQKYRDFCGKFDVGLLTGDVSLKPEASCLIMTTEILRSMLYKGADIIRDIEWVIFDEVHYVNDVERGVVWEEVIIMLPRHVNIILLSATVPNTRDFADWIGRTKQKKIHVTVTYKRPVPLEHYLFFSGELYKICENENFMAQGFRAAKDADRKKKLMAVSGMAGGGAGKRPVSQSRGQTIQSEKSGSGKGFKHSGPPVSEGFSVTSGGHQNNRNSWRTEAALWLTLIKKLLKKNLLPVVIFCFSKTRCDKSADNLTGIDLTSSSEKSQIIVFCNKAFSRLKGTDRNLPQVVRLQNLLKKGIGVHHAGLLPIVKEVVEMLFCRGLVKVLFSTETFAMGVNAPARTVVFDALRKFDGKEFRSLLPGEYIQMAGRAGRRGLDDIGTVMVLCRDEVPDEAVLKHVITGMPTKLESQFRLTYIMILHLLRLEELKVEDMLKRSFAEYHGQKTMPEKQKLLMLELQKPTKTVECIKGEPAIEEYFSLASEVEELREKISEALMQSPAAQKYLTPGRVIIIRNQSVEDHLLGLVLKTPAQTKKLIVLMLTTETATSKQASSVSFNKLEANDKSNSPGGYFVLPKGKRAVDDYVSSVTSRKGSGEVKIKLPYSGFAAGYNYEVTEIDHKEILSICEVKIKIDQVGLLEEPSNSTYSRTIQQLLPKKTGENKYPKALDPIKDLKLNNIDHVEAYRYCNVLLQKMTDNKCHGCVKLKEHMALMKEINQHREKVNALTYEMSDEALTQMPDFQGRIDVLKEIGCIDSELAVQIKGRVACEMNSGEELICTECLFDNQLEDLEPEEAVALMSAFVFQQKNTSEPNLNIRLSNAKKRLHETAIRLGKLQAEFRLPVIPEDYAQDNLKFGLVEVVYEWAKGTPFAEICELTDVPEGLIVRTIVRLDETCREFKNAASIMGNSALYKKMEVASNAIKRDIVFAASLYVTGVE